MAPSTIDTDYLVVGAGAMGMAFTDALVDHADVHVTLVDRRPTASGHWQDAYPFVRLHQASLFYGVASTELGTGSIQTTGPEAGLHERATQPEIQAYYDDVLRKLVGSGRVTFLGGHEPTDADHNAPPAGLRRGVEVPCAAGCRCHLPLPTVPATTLPPLRPPTTSGRPSTPGPARRRARRLRHRRLGHRHRRDRVAQQRCGPRPHHLVRPATLDARPGCRQPDLVAPPCPLTSWIRPPRPTRPTTSSSASRPPA